MKILNAENVSVNTIAFFLHVMLSHFRVYSNPVKSDPEVKVITNREFAGIRALEELVLWLLVSGQDCNQANYSFVPPNAENPTGFWAYNGSGAECIVQVPGVGIAQTDARNKEALMFSNSIIRDLKDDEMPVHAREMLFGAGKYEPTLKPSLFMKRPLKLGGWPQPKESRAVEIPKADSEDDGEDEGSVCSDDDE